MQVHEVMTADPITVGPDTPYKGLVDLLIEHGIGALPVVEHEGEVIGIVTETDLTSKLADRDEKRGVLFVMAAVPTGNRPAWLKKASGMTAARSRPPGW